MDYPYQKLWDGYCGVVRFLESSLQDIYRVAITAQFQGEPNRAKELLDQVGDRLQRLEEAAEVFQHFNYDLLGCLSGEEQDELGLVFAKRHALIGRREWVAWKYYFRIRLLPVPWLFRVSLNQDQLKRSQQLANRVVTTTRNTIIAVK